MRDELTRRGFRNMSPWARGVDTELFTPRRRDAPDPSTGWRGRSSSTSAGVAVEKNIETFLALDLPGPRCGGRRPQRRSWRQASERCSPAPSSART
jgi:hypothetical protein